MPDVPAINLVSVSNSVWAGGVDRNEVWSKLIFVFPCYPNSTICQKKSLHFSSSVNLSYILGSPLKLNPKYTFWGGKKLFTQRTCVLQLAEGRWGPGLCVRMLDAGTHGCLEPPSGTGSSGSGQTPRMGKPPINYFWSCCDSLQKLPYLSSSFWDIFTDDWFMVCVCFFFLKPNLESNPNTSTA